LAQAVPLSEAQQTLYDQMEESFKTLLFGELSSSQEHRDVHEHMAVSAHKLHLSLLQAGVEPVFGRHMLKNRGCPPTELEFYRHVHAVEDLIKFIGNPNSNRDPEDITLGKEFEVKIYSRRWGHEDRYRIKRTEAGWTIRNLARGGPCDKKGYPGFFQALDGDQINYPEELPGYLKWLWDRAAENGLSPDEVQAGLDSLAEWISICEQHSPMGVFSGYK
jgi:hypothetical protein